MYVSINGHLVLDSLGIEVIYNEWKENPTHTHFGSVIYWLLHKSRQQIQLITFFDFWIQSNPICQLTKVDQNWIGLPSLDWILNTPLNSQS